MEYLGAWGLLIHEKNLKSKISCQTPFNELKNAQKEISSFNTAWRILRDSFTKKWKGLFYPGVGRKKINYWHFYRKNSFCT
jgi:hypothetical protein